MNEYQRESSDLLIDAEASRIYQTRPGLPILIWSLKAERPLPRITCNTMSTIFPCLCFLKVKWFLRQSDLGE